MHFRLMATLNRQSSRQQPHRQPARLRSSCLRSRKTFSSRTTTKCRRRTARPPLCGFSSWLACSPSDLSSESRLPGRWAAERRPDVVAISAWVA